MKLVTGTPASAGMVVGKIKTLIRRYSGLDRVILSPARERAMFDEARRLAQGQLEQLIKKSNAQEKDILAFQIEVLDDKGLLKEIYDYIAVGAGAAASVERAANIYEKKLLCIEDDYFKARAVDIRDACFRVVDMLDGRRMELQLDEPCILLAEDIYPSDLSGVQREYIKGFITCQGSPQSHAAILARTLGIPAVVKAGDEVVAVKSGETVALDGESGKIYLQPDAQTTENFAHYISMEIRRRKSLERLKNKPCITVDGSKISLMANCSNAADIEYAMQQGADGIGLLRSEFMLMQQKDLPCEEAQFKYYKNCILAANGKPITIRTFDVGADKAVFGFGDEYYEINPALGLRGIRLCLQHKELFITQLCALMRAGQYGALNVMFPMITGPQDFKQALACKDEAQKRLQLNGHTYSKQIKWGAMIETPAAALQADLLAEYADFFSIGTNDLTQYTHAVDRVNPLVEKYYCEFSPAVQKLIAITMQAAKQHKIELSICGELAAKPQYAAKLCSMGITKLSMVARSVNEVKESLLGTNLKNQ